MATGLASGVLVSRAINLNWSSAYNIEFKLNHRSAPARSQGCIQLADTTPGSSGYEGMLFLADQTPYLYGEADAVYQDDTGSTVYSTNVWTRYRFRRTSATNLEFLINDALEATLTLDVSARSTANSTLYISSSAADWLDAVLADLTIWTDAGPVVPSPWSILPTRGANLWATYPLLPGASERLRDYSGNGRTLTMSGSPTDAPGSPAIWFPPQAPTLARTVVAPAASAAFLTPMRGMVGP